MRRVLVTLAITDSLSIAFLKASSVYRLVRKGHGTEARKLTETARGMKKAFDRDASMHSGIETEETRGECAGPPQWRRCWGRLRASLGAAATASGD